MRELELPVRRIVLTRHYAGRDKKAVSDLLERLEEGLRTGTLESETLLAGYCKLQYQRLGTHEAAVQRIGLNRRIVKKYVDLYTTTQSTC